MRLYSPWHTRSGSLYGSLAGAGSDMTSRIAGVNVLGVFILAMSPKMLSFLTGAKPAKEPVVTLQPEDVDSYMLTWPVPGESDGSSSISGGRRIKPGVVSVQIDG